MKSASFTVNGKDYRCPAKPIIAICLDGSSDEYLSAAMMRGLMPELQQLCVNGVRAIARAAMPTFTNVNNTSIVTGVPPSVHGISGNYFYDAIRNEEVMMNSAAFLRATTIFPSAAESGRKVAVITAKEKLRDIFASGLIERGGIAFSSEKANKTHLQTHGISNVEQLVGAETPQIYSADASLYVLKAAVALLSRGMADFLYLSTTDYIQHKAAPDEPEALDFYARLDRELGALRRLDAVIGITADHGMNAKQKSDGAPNVIFLETLLKEELAIDCRVILPITDPYVVHHGALGSFAMIYIPGGSSVDAVRSFLNGVPGITEVYTREEGARKLQLAEDRIGDLLISSGRDVTLGRASEHHDLSVLRGGLRSHGGRYEEMVPFIFSEPLNQRYMSKLAGDPRNYDLFEFLLNGVSMNPK